MIYAMRQRARADNLTICNPKLKEIDVRFSRVCSVINLHLISPQHCQCSLRIHSAFASWMQALTMLYDEIHDQ